MKARFSTIRFAIYQHFSGIIVLFSLSNGNKTTLSGMFVLDAQPDIRDAEKLQYIYASLGQGAAFSDHARWYGVT